jgi:carbon-monoxide dehydrogenase medium subunit
VKPAPFDYADPNSLEETLGLLAQYGDDAKVLAGGQSLVPMLNLRLARPSMVIDINRIIDLDEIAVVSASLHVGALVRQRALERWTAAKAPLLTEALRRIGHTAIRARGTVVGSLVHADPAAELPALFLCCEGTLTVLGPEGRRDIPAADLYVGPLTTSLRPDELALASRWPLPPPHAGWGFHEVARRHGDFALVGAAALVTTRAGRVESARIAVFGAGPTPTRAEEAERLLHDEAPGGEVIDAAAAAAAHGLDPAADLHASADYRRRVAATLVGRALRDAFGRARDAAA